MDGADNTAPQISVTEYRIYYTESRQRGAEAVACTSPSYIFLYIAHEYAKHFDRSKANTMCRYWQALWTLWLMPEDDLKEINLDRRVEASSVVVRTFRGASLCSLSVVNWNLCCTRRWLLNLFWRWKWQVSPKSFCLSTRSYVATSQKTSIFIFTSNLCY